MDGGGLTVGGIASVGFAGGAGMNVPSAVSARATASISFGATPTPAATDFVVRISDAAMKALALDIVNAVDNGSVSRLTNDLAALALLAILERDRQQGNSMVTATAAIGAYLAVQALSNG